MVILDRKTYIDKCSGLLSSKQFTLCNSDPTKQTEGQIQRAVRKIKTYISETDYKTIYPTGSCPGRFYGTAKLHKLKEGQTVDDLPIRPIISNIGTASYHLAKYLAKLLAPLACSDYTVSSTDNFVTQIQNFNIPPGYKLVSFDVVSLFTIFL